MTEPGAGDDEDPGREHADDEGRGPATGGGTGAGAAEPLALRARRAVVLLVAVLVAYYAAPVDGLPSGGGIVASAVGLLAAVAVLAAVIVRQVQRLARSDPRDTSVRLDSLVFLVYLVVPVFALGYLALEHADDGQFAGIETKTDALYYTMSTLATVGFGDVVAEGQLARALVTVQITFNLVFVAMLASVLTTHPRARRGLPRD